MDATYRVYHPVYGVILKIDANIKSARTWAKKAFPRDACTVSRAVNRFCDDCDCNPCCCMIRSDV